VKECKVDPVNALRHAGLITTEGGQINACLARRLSQIPSFEKVQNACGLLLWENGNGAQFVRMTPPVLVLWRPTGRMAAKSRPTTAVERDQESTSAPVLNLTGMAR
jgi:hypothetical protein